MTALETAALARAVLRVEPAPRLADCPHAREAAFLRRVLRSVLLRARLAAGRRGGRGEALLEIAGVAGEALGEGESCD